ncbi:MAG: sigma-54-dependent transcriptional regulator [Candidatus Binatia bacterium]
MLKKLVIADDDPTMRAALREALSGPGHHLSLFPDGEAAEAHLRQADTDVVISDVRMPGLSGLDLLKRFPQIPFILISGHATVPEAVEAMKMGAYDFIVKPFSHRELLAVVEAALRRVPSEELSDTAASEFVTINGRMRAFLDFARQVAKSHASILIQGESGTGKELLAHYLHAHSRRHSGPFVAVNCAALPEGLLESELFGYERGAFTGAVASRVGKFESADGGTLLLDEISEMPLALQAKLLRVLQEREVDRVGGKNPLPIDIRVISTTNRDLREMIRAGTFREDLYYRLNVVPVRLLPLRERLDDIEPLAQAFFSRRGYPESSLSRPALDHLKKNSWRGNVRELFNVLERAAIIAQGGAIAAAHLFLDDDRESWSGLMVPDRPGVASECDPGRDCALVEVALKENQSLGSVRAMEEQLIYQALKKANNNRTLAAKALGISVRTLRNKLKLYRERDCLAEA